MLTTSDRPITLTVFSKYGQQAERFTSLEGARLRAAALYGDLPVRIYDEAGTEYSRYGIGNV